MLWLVDNNAATQVALDEAICEPCDKQIKCSNNTTNLLSYTLKNANTKYPKAKSVI